MPELETRRGARGRKIVMVGRVEMPATVYQAIAKAAERGAKLLDRELPGWHARVKTTKLKVSDECRCVFGQLDAESLIVAADARYEFGYMPPRSTYRCVDESFYWRWSTALWSVLQEEWLRQIRARRVAEKAAR